MSTSRIKTLAELKELCKDIGVTVEVTPMYRKDFLNVRYEPHLDALYVEYSPERERSAVRAALRELQYSGLLGDPRI